MNPIFLAIAQMVAATLDSFLKTYLERKAIAQHERDSMALFAKELENAALKWRLLANADPSNHDKLRDLGATIEFSVTPDPGSEAAGESLHDDHG